MQDITAPPIGERPRSRSITIFATLLAFLLGATLAAWALSQGYLGGILSRPAPAPTEAAEPAAAATPPAAENTRAMQPGSDEMKAIGSVEGRVALLEDRLSRIDFKTDAASGNAARAEGLLIAFAARRMIDRGEPLSYVADQLRLRFTNAQPRAVQTVIDFSRNPVTIDELTARLEALSPELTDTKSDESLWARARHELGNLFVVRRDSSALLAPTARIERARVMLTAKRIDNAISEVERLPGADAANLWIADARRYEAVQRALDLLETTAMLEPRRLKDADGNQVDQPSPLATSTGQTPAPAAVPTPPAQAAPAATAR